MAFCIDLIGHKIDGCIKTLEKSIRRSPAWEQAIKRSYADLTRLECNPPHDVVSLRALEAGSEVEMPRMPVVAWLAEELVKQGQPDRRHHRPDSPM